MYFFPELNPWKPNSSFSKTCHLVQFFFPFVFFFSVFLRKVYTFKGLVEVYNFYIACFLLHFAYTHFLLFCNHVILSFCFLVVDNPTNPCGHLRCPPYSRCIVGTYGTAKCACAKNSCPQRNEFVCGSNGKTYRNTCEMENYSCYNNETITVAHKGHCRSKWSQMAIITAVYV